MTTAVITTKPLAIISIIHDGAPDPVFWPDGTATHGTSIGYSVGEWLFVSVQYEAPPSKFHYPTSAPPMIVSLDGSVLRVTYEWQTVALDAAKASLRADVDQFAELRRTAWITPGSGQAMVYMQKHAEAQAFFKDPIPDLANYPLLAASIGIEGAALADVAKRVAQTAAQWTTIAASIEKVRLAAKAEIDAAQTVGDAVAACGAAVWP